MLVDTCNVANPHGLFSRFMEQKWIGRWMRQYSNNLSRQQGQIRNQSLTHVLPVCSSLFKCFFFLSTFSFPSTVYLISFCVHLTPSFQTKLRFTISCCAFWPANGSKSSFWCFTFNKNYNFFVVGIVIVYPLSHLDSLKEWLSNSYSSILS